MSVGKNETENLSPGTKLKHDPRCLINWWRPIYIGSDSPPVFVQQESPTLDLNLHVRFTIHKHTL